MLVHFEHKIALNESLVAMEFRLQQIEIIASIVCPTCMCGTLVVIWNLLTIFGETCYANLHDLQAQGLPKVF